MNVFEKERAFYFANKARLVSLFHGKWLIIKGDMLMGVSDDMYEAFEQSHTLQLFYGGPPIMMHQCLYNEPCMGIPGGLTWLDDLGNSVEADPRDLIAYEEGTKIKFAPDYKGYLTVDRSKFTENQFNTLSNIWNDLKGEKK